MTKILIKRGTATQWTNSTTALLAGELGLDTTNNIIKVGDGSTLWNSLSGLTLTLAQVSELAQDALSTAFSNGTHSNITVTYNDAGNAISLATGPDVVTTTSLNNTLTNPTSGYVSIGDVGVADGVASLGPDGKIPDSEIPAGIARDTEVSTAIANLVNSAPSTLDTLNELATALGNDANFATTTATSIGNKVSKAGGDVITSSLPSVVGLTIKAATSQTANLQQWQTGAGNLAVWVDGNGQFETGYYYTNFGGGSYKNSGLITVNPANNIVPLVIAGVSGQTSNLQEWKNSSGTVLSRVSSNGKILVTGDNLDNFQSIGSSNTLYNGFTTTTNTGSGSYVMGTAGSAETLFNVANAFYIYDGIAGVMRFKIMSTGLVGINSYSPAAQLQINSSSASTIGLIVKGSASQTANIQEWQNSAGTVLASIASTGQINAGAGFYTDWAGVGTGRIGAAHLSVSSQYLGNIVSIFKGTSGQTANLTEWQNSAGTILSKVDASGNIFVGTNQVLTKEDEKNIYLTDSGTARTLGSGDAYKIIEFTSSNTIAVTIPNDASDTTFPIGSYVEVRQMGGGQITVSATSPATLVATDNQYKTRVQYSAIVLEKRASNAWYLAGDTTA